MLRELNLQELKEIYDGPMVNDFPACEIKPFWAILKMFEAKEYFAYGNYVDGERVAYVLIAKPKEGRVALLDYFAVAQEKRGGGYGSKTLGELKQFVKGSLDGLIIESEHVDYASDEKDKEKRSRRIHFYEKNGLKRLDFLSRIYGTEYTVLFLDTQKESESESLKLEEEYLKIYEMMMSKDWNEQYVQTWKA